MKFFKEMRVFSNFLERNSTLEERNSISTVLLGGFIPGVPVDLNENSFKNFLYESQKDSISKVPIFLDGRFMESYLSHFPPSFMKKATSYLLGKGLYEAKNLIQMAEDGGLEFNKESNMPNVVLRGYQFDVPSNFFIELLNQLERPVNIDALRGMSLEDQDARRQYEEDGFGYYGYNFNKESAFQAPKDQIIGSNWLSVRDDNASNILKNWLEYSASGWLGDIEEREFNEINFQNMTGGRDNKLREFIDSKMEKRVGEYLTLSAEELEQINGGYKGENSSIEILPNGKVTWTFKSKRTGKTSSQSGHAVHFKTGKAVDRDSYIKYDKITKSLLSDKAPKGGIEVPKTPEEFKEMLSELIKNATTADQHEFAVRQFNLDLESMNANKKRALGIFQPNDTQRRKTQPKDDNIKNALQEYFIFKNFNSSNNTYKVQTVKGGEKNSYFVGIIRKLIGGAGRESAYNMFVNEIISSGAIYVLEDAGAAEPYIKDMFENMQNNEIEKAESIYKKIEYSFIGKKANSWVGIATQLFKKHDIKNADTKTTLRQQDYISDPRLRPKNNISLMKEIEEKKNLIKNKINNLINSKAIIKNLKDSGENSLKAALETLIVSQKEALNEYKDLFYKYYKYIGGQGIAANNIEESALNWAMYKLEVEKRTPQEQMLVSVPDINIEKLYNDFNQQLAARTTQQQPQVKFKANQEEINQAAKAFNNPQIMQVSNDSLTRDENQIRLANIFLYQVPNTPQNQVIKQRLSKIPKISGYNPNNKQL